ncbi:hypothetical protein IG631_22327 [Alternaria alternata]|nr:hypothetical protein IG631_22327 [Alternaria alternata]
MTRLTKANTLLTISGGRSEKVSGAMDGCRNRPMQYRPWACCSCREEKTFLAVSGVGVRVRLREHGSCSVFTSRQDLQTRRGSFTAPYYLRVVRQHNRTEMSF